MTTKGTGRTGKAPQQVRKADPKEPGRELGSWAATEIRRRHLTGDNDRNSVTMAKAGGKS